MRGGSVVMDWDQIVKHLTVSSNESQAYRLIDSSHSTFWQSSGPQGKVGTITYPPPLSLSHTHTHMCFLIPSSSPSTYSSLVSMCILATPNTIATNGIWKVDIISGSSICSLSIVALGSTGNAEKHPD